MKGLLPIWVWVVLGLALVVSLWIDFANTAQGGAIDLRNRITGERLLEHGIDAYRYKWSEGDPAEYCDLYNNPRLPVSKTTATPTLLMVNMPLAALPYRVAQLLWFFVQWALLLGMGWIWLRAGKTMLQRGLIALFIAGFTYTSAWRLHAERGQAYVLLAFLFVVWLAATLDGRKFKEFAAGFLAGVLVALRPPFALLVPFIALHRRGQLPGVVVGIVVGFGAPLFIYAASWGEYFSGMQANSEIYRSGDDVLPGPQNYPPTIEGVPTDILGHFVPIPYADFSAHALLRWLGIMSFPDLPVLLVAVVPFLFWLWLSRKQPLEQLLPGLAAWLFIVDLFLPAYRNSYNDVMIINVVAVALISATKWPWPAAICALGLPVGWCIYVFAPEQPWLINLPTFLFSLGAVLFVFGLDRSLSPAATRTTQARLS
jgi:hypothetical protein